MESYAYVLDYLPSGRQSDRGYTRLPLAYGLGETELKLLEIVPRANTPLVPGQRIALLPVGAVAPPIDHVRRRIPPEELTTAARSELPRALEQIVRAQPERYLRFFNEAPAVSRRFHLLELLPGIGKKTMQAIVDERRRSPFTSFEDLAQRVHLKDPERLIAARMDQELTGVEDKYRLFVPL
jgi:putative nucleotide binding protein